MAKNQSLLKKLQTIYLRVRFGTHIYFVLAVTFTFLIVLSRLWIKREISVAQVVPKYERIFDGWSMKNKTYSLEELSLCNSRLTHNFYNCPKDASCKKCFEDQEEWKRIYFHYVERLAKEIEKASVQIGDYVRENYGPPTEDKIIVVIACDERYMEMVANWKQSPNVRDVPYVLAGSNARAIEKAKNFGLKTLPPFWLHLVEDSADNPFRVSVSLAAFLTGSLVKMGYNTLMQDADVVWIKDPRPFFIQESRSYGHDIMSEFGNRWDHNGPMNSGLVFVSNHRRELVTWFLTNLISAFPITAYDTGNDQALWNAMIKHIYFRQVHFSLLPYDRFICLTNKNDIESVTEKTITAHTLGNNKKENMQKAGVWWLKQV